MSWRRAWIQAGIVFGLLVLAGGIVSGAGWVKDPYKFGEGLGRFSVFAVLTTLGVSYLWQTGKRVIAVVVIVLALGGIGGLARMLVRSHSSVTRTELMEEDRAPLRVEGDRLVHPTLLFSIPKPPAEFKESPEILEQLAAMNDPYTATWAYSDVDSGRTRGVILVANLATEREISGFADGIRESLRSNDMTIESEAIAEVDGELQYRLKAGYYGVTVEVLGRAFRLGEEAFFAVALSIDDGPEGTAFVQGLKVP